MATSDNNNENRSQGGPSRGRPGGPRPRFSPCHLRAWRTYRRMTLRQLADAINKGESEPIISYASLARIEQGLQPYSQPVLEAAARALHTTPGVLLTCGPDETNEIGDLLRGLDERRRARAIAVLQALKKAP